MALSTALTRAEAQLSTQETQLATLHARVEAHTITRADLGAALSEAKALTAHERKATREAERTSTRALAAAEQLQCASETAAAERDEALGQVQVAEQLAERISWAAREQQEELETSISELTQNRWQLSTLPERRNWSGVS